MSIVKKNTANENSIDRKTKQNRLMLLSNYAVCVNKKLTFITILIIFEMIGLKWTKSLKKF